jgi:CBS domain-containing protein
VVVAEKLVGIVTEADFLQLTLDLLQETQGSSIQAEKMVNS